MLLLGLGKGVGYLAGDGALELEGERLLGGMGGLELDFELGSRALQVIPFLFVVLVLFPHPVE